jgi:hypothetical protein
MKDHGQDGRGRTVILRHQPARRERRLIAWDEKQSLRRQHHAGRHPVRNTRLVHGR